ncbi:hypothetical protein OF83DRAFT_1135861 [Amylostereum chailletii]|nr:hypothetical protein OF83DRAFT_1135861 [Amylostereum chailletii]
MIFFPAPATDIRSYFEKLPGPLAHAAHDTYSKINRFRCQALSTSGSAVSRHPQAVLEGSSSHEHGGESQFFRARSPVFIASQARIQTFETAWARSQCSKSTHTPTERYVYAEWDDISQLASWCYLYNLSAVRSSSDVSDRCSHLSPKARGGDHGRICNPPNLSISRSCSSSICHWRIRSMAHVIHQCPRMQSTRVPIDASNKDLVAISRYT